jgi:hypothetical protein
MTINGINAVCGCDSKEYSLFTGQAQGGAQYPLKQYRVQANAWKCLAFKSTKNPDSELHQDFH